MSDHDSSHHQGLQQDLRLLAKRTDRRELLRWMAVSSLMPIIGCGGSTTGGGGGDASGCSRIPEETAGPYPGDGSNGANALVLSGIVRGDIRSSIAGASGVADGVPLTLTLTLVDSTDSCTPLVGYAIYLWHCDRVGRYSMYSSGVTQENYLRGVQETDEQGQVTFSSVFPACYSGRWPHIHFEIYPGLASANASRNKIATSQLALPEDICEQVYATAGYSQSVRNLGQVSLSSDNVFRDGSSTQLATVTGNTTDGYVAKLVVGINP
jgi:protocatechuate 3,4-dioxygenase beta subunit